MSDPDGKSLKQITNLDNEKGALRLDAGLEAAALHGSRQEALQLQRRGREDDDDHVRHASARIGSVSVSPDSKWVCVLEAGPHAALARLHRADRRRRGATRLRRPPALLREQRRVDRRRPLHRVHVVRRRQQRHRVAGRHHHDDGAVGDAAAGSGSRSAQPRHRQRGAGACGGRGRSRRRGPRAGAGGAPAPVDVQIDWNNIARRARQITVPGDTIGGLDAGADGRSVAFNRVVRWRTRRRWRRRRRRHGGHLHRERGHGR